MAGSVISGFEFRMDDGKVFSFGFKTNKIATDWIVLGGPILGHGINNSNYPYGYRKWYGHDYLRHLSFVIGDECTPKYFLSGQLVLPLGSVREVKFYWQNSYRDYLDICAAVGLFHVDVPLEIDWIEVAKNRVEAVFHP